MKILIVGATGGIGTQIVLDLCRKNNVYAIGSSKKSLIKLRERTKSSKLKLYKADITKKYEVKRVMAKISSLDVLINCAGILRPVGKFLHNDLDQWKKTVEVNFLGTVHTCYYALPKLLRSRRGKIINFAGGGSAYPRLFHTAYASSKAAVVRFTDSLAEEFDQLDINVIAPGAYKTKMWKDEKVDKEPEQWGDMQRLLEFIEFLISKKSDNITGKFIHYKDEWEKFDYKKLGKDIYTLRRIEK